MFDKVLYDRYDKYKLNVAQTLAVSGYEVDARETKGIDITVRNKETNKKSYHEVECRPTPVWKGEEIRYSTISIPHRKKRLTDMYPDGIFYWVVHPSGKFALMIFIKSLVDFPVIEKCTINEGNQKFFNIPKEKFTLVYLEEMPKDDTKN